MLLSFRTACIPPRADSLSPQLRANSRIPPLADSLRPCNACLSLATRGRQRKRFVVHGPWMRRRRRPRAARRRSWRRRPRNIAAQARRHPNEAIAAKRRSWRRRPRAAWLLHDVLGAEHHEASAGAEIIAFFERIWSPGESSYIQVAFPGITSPRGKPREHFQRLICVALDKHFLNMVNQFLNT